MKRKATAVWNGDIESGSGHLTTQSNALDKVKYSANSRFSDGKGTNPEELIAAAHAGWFTLKLDLDLTEAGYEVESLETSSHVTIKDGTITLSELSLEADVPGISDDKFQEMAQSAKENCPVSKGLSFEIQLSAKLKS
ncbi:MAG: OsmC family peroxiredoxin [Cyclobacteriaceae bacterium]